MTNYPKKLYYSISEVARISGVKPHVLRYWETEFPTLKPRKARTGSRRYRQVDIDEILAIKELLYDQGFKIAGAKKMRRDAKMVAKQDDTQSQTQMAISFEQMSDDDRLGFVKKEMQTILEMIRGLSALTETPGAKKPGPVRAKVMKAKG